MEISVMLTSRKAIDYHEERLKIGKEFGDPAGEGGAYGNLCNAYDSLGDYGKAIEYHEKDSKIGKEIGDLPGEGGAYGNLGNAYQSLGYYRKAIEYHEKRLKTAKEIGDRAGEIGTALQFLRDYGKSEKQELITTLEIYTFLLNNSKRR